MFISDSLSYNILGLNISANLMKNTRFYGQFAIGNYQFNSFAYQFGSRYYLKTGIHQMMFQLEFNGARNSMYVSSNDRLSYSHYNLALAHPKGTNFNEVLLRYNYSRLRWYVELKSIVYLIKDYSSQALLAGNGIVEEKSGASILEDIELGYRLNKKMNLSVFINWQFRHDSTVSAYQTTNVFGFGMRTGINNHYRDF
jgi:hypothetical protein